MNKADRIKAAQLAAAECIGKRAVSLTVALVRAKVLRECLEPPLVREAADPRPEDQLRAEAADAVLKLELTDPARVDSIYSYYLGALYAVVEKWRAWGFADPVVDQFVVDSRITLLKKHRHAIFHADHYNHDALTALAEAQGIVEWADRLLAALEAFFRNWHAGPEQHIRDHLARTRA